MEDVPEIDAATAKRRLDTGDAVFVDIRDPRHYAQGRIRGALHLGDANVGNFVSQADKRRTHIVCCYHGRTSQGAAAWLKEQGFQDVYSLAGGFEGWRQHYDYEQP